ncbi:MAG: hypothetical protein ACI8Q1_002053 [Parvicella sp.]|jgi:hypothetical protein
MKHILYIFILLAGFSSIQAQLFKEVSTEVGLDYMYPGTDHQEVGAGITILDINNDGWDDIFQSGGIFPSKLWINKKGKFVDATVEYGIDTVAHLYVQGVCAADFDNDGYEDLFVSNMAIPPHRGDDSFPMLLKNIEGKRFEPVFAVDFFFKGHYPASYWGDINGDGFVDLYLIDYVEEMDHTFYADLIPSGYKPYCLHNKVYLNEGGAGFKEVSRELNLNDVGCGLAGAFTDFDNDNDVDFILMNDFGSWNHLGNKIYRNDYPDFHFTDITDSVGFKTEFYGMGVGPGDINNDGILDYYLTNIGENRLIENHIDTMYNVARQKGVDFTSMTDTTTGTSWSGIFFDIENDGDVDLFVTKGYLESLEPVEILDENRMFINDGIGNFTDVTKKSGANDSLVHRGAAYVDYDHDGDLDIVCGVIKMRRSEFAKTDQKIKLFENQANKDNNWIGFKLIGKDGVNHSAVGCSVTFVNGDTGKQIREVDGGTAHSSQSTKTLYFGLGEEKFAKEIEIQWIGKGTTEIKKLKGGHVYSIDPSGEIKVIY